MMGCDGNGRRREAGDGGAGMAGALGGRVTVGRGPGKRGTWERAAAESSAGERRWRLHGCRMRAMAHFWLQWDGCCEGGCAGKGK